MAVRSLAGTLAYKTIQDPTTPRAAGMPIGRGKGRYIGIIDLKGLQFSRFGFNGAVFAGLSEQDHVGIEGICGVI